MSAASSPQALVLIPRRRRATLHQAAEERISLVGQVDALPFSLQRFSFFSMAARGCRLEQALSISLECTPSGERRRERKQLGVAAVTRRYRYSFARLPRDWTSVSAASSPQALVLIPRPCAAAGT